MGCASSKAAATGVDVYRPPPSSFAVFDINSIKEPWLSFDTWAETEHNKEEEHDTKKKLPAAPILEKLETDTPRSWDEVSKALQDLKPKLTNTNTNTDYVVATSATTKDINTNSSASATKQIPRKSTSIHTVEEVEAKLSSKLQETPPMKTELKKKPQVVVASKTASAEVSGSKGDVIKPLKENMFIVRDRMERGKEGKMASKRDPLSEFPEKCPPGGENKVVVYTTSLRGVRRTYEDCMKVHDVVELLHVVYDERDVSLHGQYLKELKTLFEDEMKNGGGGEVISVPRVFVKGRYIGGVEEVVGLNETGRLGRLMSWAGVERRVGWRGCEGCGGARFLPCFDCGGSCRVLVDDDVKERCGKCNENGLVHCPICA